MSRAKQDRNVYVLVTLDEGQFAIGERSVVSVYRTLHSARVAMKEDIRIIMRKRGYTKEDIVKECGFDFAMTKDERYSWSIEEATIGAVYGELFPRS